jgi:hypothetical protein
MKRWQGLVGVLALVGLVATPAFADQRLTVTGFIDNHIRYMHNISGNDRDLTIDNDEPFNGRTRGRFFFNVALNETSKAVLGIELDQTWGQRADNAFAAFDSGTDNVQTFELKWLYTDLKIPDLPVRFEVGGLSVQATRLKDLSILHQDVAAVTMRVDAHPQVKLYVWYTQLGENFDDLEGALGQRRYGEDYATGITVQTTPIKGLDIDIPFAWQYIGIDDPVTKATSTLRIPSAAMANESRFWIGVDARWRYGNFTFSPTFIYNGGTREFNNGQDSDLSSFLLDVRGAYVVGPFTVTAKFVYTPGNEASDNIDVPGTDINFYQSIAVDTVYRSADWFEIFGFNIDSTSDALFNLNDPRSIRSNLSFDQFGLIFGAVRGDYKVLPQLTFTAALGFFAAAEKVGRPTRSLGLSSPATYNYTGRDQYLATEIDAWITYNVIKGTDFDIWFAYAFVGDALNLQAPGGPVQQAEDVVGIGARLISRF